jgi:hypothetical protein
VLAPPETGGTKKVSSSMTTYELYVPIRTSSHNGFFNVVTHEVRHILGCRVRLFRQAPYHYLVFENVDKDLASDVLQNLKRILPWASLRLNFSIMIEPGDIQTADNTIFNGNIPTIVRSGTGASPIRSAGSHRSEEGDLRSD